LHRNLIKNIDPDYQALQPQAGTQLELALHLSTIREFERSRVQKKKRLTPQRDRESDKTTNPSLVETLQRERERDTHTHPHT
jgi:hypothetical protein